jgi:hypothetical protein
VKISGHRCSSSKIGNPAWRQRRSNRRGVAFRPRERRSKPVDTMLHAIVVRGLGRRFHSCRRISGVIRRHGSIIGSSHGGTALIPGGGWPVNDPARLPPFFPIGARGPQARSGAGRRRLFVFFFSSPARCLAAGLAPRLAAPLPPAG